VIRVNVAAVGSVWPGGSAIGEDGVGADDHLGIAVACQPLEAKTNYLNAALLTMFSGFVGRFARRSLVA
jgi:hypothetical protein